MAASTQKSETKTNSNSNGNSKKSSNQMMILGAVVILIIAALAIILYTGALGNNAAKQPTSTSNKTQLTSSPVSTGSSTPTPASYDLISQSQAASFAGSGGGYGVLVANSTDLQQYPPNFSVTAAYGVQYNITTGPRLAILQEVVATSQNSPLMYGDSERVFLNTTSLTASGGKDVNVTKNASSNGLTYTAISYLIPNNALNTTDSGIVLVGYKGDRFVYFNLLMQNVTAETNSAPIAATVSSQIN